jgi:hypothetical protein
MDTRDLPATEYCENGSFVDSPLRWHLKGLQQTASGYGGKLTSSKKTWFNGRLYRVYIMCYSNSGTAYIIVKGKRRILLNTAA